MTETGADRSLFGRALREHQRGEGDGTLRLHSDLGEPDELPVAFFFRGPDDMGRLEREAVDRCRGAVLDVGGGAGAHALVLQERGHPVTAIDVVSEAVEIMADRGVADVRHADVFEFAGGPYDTVLMLVNGIGMTGTLPGLDRFLGTAPRLLREDGRILLDSADLRPRFDGVRRRADGRYVGEVHLQLEYGGERGPPYPQLYVDPDTLADRAARHGWRTDVVARDETGEYLARLTRVRSERANRDADGRTW